MDIVAGKSGVFVDGGEIRAAVNTRRRRHQRSKLLERKPTTVPILPNATDRFSIRHALSYGALAELNLQENQLVRSLRKSRALELIALWAAAMKRRKQVRSGSTTSSLSIAYSASEQRVQGAEESQVLDYNQCNKTRGYRGRQEFVRQNVE
jgi:hypothetical protein